MKTNLSTVRTLLTIFLLFGCSDGSGKSDETDSRGTDSNSDSGTDSGSDSVTPMSTDSMNPIGTDSIGTDSIGTDSLGTDSTPAVCGNGVVEQGELCDDGGMLDSDGCSADCIMQNPEYDCSIPGVPCVNTVICGNGSLEGKEVCDEGKGNKTDGCSAECDAVTDGWVCPRPGRPCVETPVCGDGVRERGEQCDDANEEGEDGCSPSCEEEAGYHCVPGKACVLLACGDGTRTPDEACDDGNTSEGDGCGPTCEVEEGYRCSSVGCSAECGDGVVVGAEKCDDGNRESGDGCNVQCSVEPHYDCDDSAPSICATTIVCGNGKVEPGEVCDPGVAGHETCFSTGASACKAYENDLTDDPVCGNGVIEYSEGCDGDNGVGCSDTCEVEDGYACPIADYCYWIPQCGDSIVQSGEECDVGTATSLACDGCIVQDDWYCSGSPSECVASVCQDGERAPDEQCDDGNGKDGDGCSALCEVEAGWTCPPGIKCISDCGDGVVQGAEQCDDGNAKGSDGCSNCRVDPGFDCGTAGTTCIESVCGNDKLETGEGCDDGNSIAGDGCGATCQLEPEITVGPDPTVVLTCGDGMITSGEQCDDGNVTSGDGCSKTCVEEPGWVCDPNTIYPDGLEIKVTYRDFKHQLRVGGHPHMSSAGHPTGGDDLGIVGDVCTADNTGTCGRLDASGKPELAPGDHKTITWDIGDDTVDDWDYHAAAFSLWYRDTNAASLLDAVSQATGGTQVIDMAPAPAVMPAIGLDTLQLARVGTTSAYAFESDENYFYPLGTTRPLDPVEMRGFGCTRGANLLGGDTAIDDSYGCGTWDSVYRNFHFTSELRYFFQYQGGEILTFFGDDDVWVFVNGRLAVDIGGIHVTRWGRVILGDDGALGVAADSDCTVNNNGTQITPADCELEPAEAADNNDTRFGLVKGEVYEIVIFQAERKPRESNYRLTLDGFIAPRSFCNPFCGDGIMAGAEICDEGEENVDDVYGACNTSCSFTYCGDKTVQTPDEECDNGLNVDPPWVATVEEVSSTCSPGCLSPSYCGDGVLQSAYEVCDDGVNDNSYGGCASDCQSLGGYCGDGEVEPEIETCDLGPDAVYVTYSADGTGCGYDCQKPPYCGDEIRNGTEQCDGTVGCGADCQHEPFCGDGLVATDGSEECDYGEFAFDSAGELVYGGCNELCELGPYCGDNEVQAGVEECDEGVDNDDTTYEGCSTGCTLGPRCGDGVLQSVQGEVCDNGYNEDTYLYSDDACGPECTAVPFCGDGEVQDDYELCDNGAENDDDAYNGCTTSCEWGPYCGDGIRQEPQEHCDHGMSNAAYSPSGPGCGYDCQPAPYCGDGIRNGSEECDDGTELNDGRYGGCNSDCTRQSFCGDYVVDLIHGEQCDDGPVGSLTCYADCTNTPVPE